MASIKDLITAENIAVYWNEMRTERPPYFGSAKFPADKQLGLRLEWIKGASGVPVRLMPSAFDANVIPLSRNGFGLTEAEMPFFKNSRNINEKLRQELNMALSSNNAAVRDMLLRRVFNDAVQLIEYADATREAMRMQLLTTGKIVVEGNGVNKTFEYGVTSGQKKTLSDTAKWNAPTTAQPIADIAKWQLAIARATGVKPTEILLNSATLALIAQCQSVKVGIYPLASGGITPTDIEVKDYIARQTGAVVYVYDKGYKNESGAFVPFVPDNTVVLMPREIIGRTMFGTTPEESDLMASSVANVRIVDTGVAVTTAYEVDPVNVMTKVSQVCLPSGENIDKIFIATVA